MKLELKNIANPYSIFALSWSICLILYSFGWAGIFPSLSFPLASFLIILIVVFALTSIFYKKIKPSVVQTPVILNYKLLLIINSLIWLVTFLYAGVPIISGIRDMDFGIPFFKNFATSFNNFLSIYCFYLYLTTRKKRFIFFSVYCLLFYILVISRGNIMMCLCTMFFVWMNVKAPVLSLKKFTIILSSLLLIIYLFGVAGNLRSIKDLASHNPNFDQTYNSDIILQIGDASDSFRNSFVPGEFFWSYAYITSPLSNLQYNINTISPAFTPQGVSRLVLNELFFDAISKKISEPLNLQPIPPNMIVETLAVSSTLAGSYMDAGWLGMMLFMAVFWIFPIGYTFLIQKTPLGILGISTMCTIYFFSIFDNMFVLTGLTFQIFYPIIFDLINKIKYKHVI